MTTDGIIQEVFDRYNNHTTRPFDLLLLIEQELIAEIKKEFTQDTYTDKDGYWSYPEHPSIDFILERLIGDNK
jgi:hypothetical protein